MATYPVSKVPSRRARGVADPVPAGDGSLHLFGDAAHREDSEQNEEYGRAWVQERCSSSARMSPKPATTSATAAKPALRRASRIARARVATIVTTVTGRPASDRPVGRRERRLGTA